MSALKSISKAVPVGYHNGITSLRQAYHVKTGARVSKPNMIYVMINNRCNLKCLYCDIWKYNGEGDLDKDTWIKAFDELLDWVKRPKLNIAGGEPFLRKDMFEILEFCIKKGAITGVVTNGWALNPKLAPKAAGLGLSNINISIDTLDAKTFDFMRGKPGHSERTIETIKRLCAEVHKQGVDTKIYLKTVVCGANIDSLVPLVKFAEDHGITGVTFQPLEAVFSRTTDYGNEWHKNTPLWPEDWQPFTDLSQQLIEMRDNGAPITNPSSHLASWPAYFQDPINGVGGQIGADSAALSGDEEHIPCRVGHTHLYFTANGNFKLCWDYPDIGNIKTDSIREGWVSDKAEKLRNAIAKCNKPCTKTCMLDRNFKDTFSTFVDLMKPGTTKATPPE